MQNQANTRPQQVSAEEITAVIKMYAALPERAKGYIEGYGAAILEEQGDKIVAVAKNRREQKDLTPKLPTDLQNNLF